jgi:hypothetical protein
VVPAIVLLLGSIRILLARRYQLHVLSTSDRVMLWTFSRCCANRSATQLLRQWYTELYVD